VLPMNPVCPGIGTRQRSSEGREHSRWIDVRKSLARSHPAPFRLGVIAADARESRRCVGSFAHEQRARAH